MGTFVIPKGSTPVGFTVTTSVNVGANPFSQRAKVWLDDELVVNWEAKSVSGVSQVAQSAKDRNVERKCRVEIQNDYYGGKWQANTTKSSKFTTPPTGNTQGYVLHIVYSDTDPNPPVTADFDDCVVHAMYLVEDEKPPVPPPTLNPTLTPGAPLADSINNLAEAIKLGSNAVKEQAAQNFLALVEKSATDAFSSPQQVAQVIDSVLSGSDRTKGTVMYAVGKILMNSPALAATVEDKIKVVLELLKSDNPTVLTSAAEALWMFSFDPSIAEKLKGNKEVITELQKLSGSSDPTLAKLARGVLFQLGLLQVATPVCNSPCPHCIIAHPPGSTPAGGSSSTTPSGGSSSSTPSSGGSSSTTPSGGSSSTTPSGGSSSSTPSSGSSSGDTLVVPAPLEAVPLKKGSYIMLSYNWGSQEMVKKVKETLDKNGYHSWIDLEQMQGSTLEAMALAVEGAALVLVCYTRKYKESAACRTEAEYSYTLKKPIIPLKMDKEYNADGWLGALLGPKLYYEFYADSDFNDAMSRLMRELGTRGKY